MGEDVLAGYGEASERSMAKEIAELDDYCRDFLALCTFVLLSTATNDGQPDVAPRGGPPGFLRVQDPRTLVLPDLLGNNRLDSLRKVAVNPRVALLCLVPGLDESLRIYGRAELHRAGTPPSDVGSPPRSVMSIHVERAFMHCPKALARGRVWDSRAHVPRDSFPSLNEVLRAHRAAPAPGAARD